MLQAIVQKEIVTTNFDFDGKNYKRSKAPEVLAQLEREKEAVQKEVDILDQTLFRYFYAVDPLIEAERLKGAYHRYFGPRTKADNSLEKMDHMMDMMGLCFAERQ